MGEEFKLPASSYEEIEKIIIAYGQTDGDASLDDIHQYCGVSKSMISRNSGFLVSVNIIEGGKSKTITQKGKNLSRALEHGIDDEISRLWREIISENEFLTKMVTAVKIRKGMEPDSFQSHIAYSSGQKDSSYVRTGSSTIIDIFKVANLIEEEDGNLVTKNDKEEKDIKNYNEDCVTNKHINKEKPINITQKYADGKITINININVTTKPSELDDIGKKLNKVINEIKNVQITDEN